MSCPPQQYLAGCPTAAMVCAEIGTKERNKSAWYRARDPTSIGASLAVLRVYRSRSAFIVPHKKRSLIRQGTGSETEHVVASSLKPVMLVHVFLLKGLGSSLRLSSAQASIGVPPRSSLT